MNEFYLSGIAFINAIFEPLYYFLELWVPPDITGSLDGVTTVMSWVGFLHDSSIFPLYFILTLDIFVVSFLASLVMRFLRWIMDIIPFA